MKNNFDMKRFYKPILLGLCIVGIVGLCGAVLFSGGHQESVDFQENMAVDAVESVMPNIVTLTQDGKAQEQILVPDHFAEEVTLKKGMTVQEKEDDIVEQKYPLEEKAVAASLEKQQTMSETRQEEHKTPEQIVIDLNNDPSFENPFEKIADQEDRKADGIEPIFTPVPVKKVEDDQKEKKSKDGKPKIVIVIDDMGLNHRLSKKVVQLSSGLTLAYLPYADGLDKQTKDASKAGHVLMVHMPMEPSNLKKNNPGPHALLLGNTQQENVENLRHNLSQFSGFIGFNNHMGSAFTANKEAFEPVAREAVGRNLLFLDSRTSNKSIAYEMTKALGGKALVRDVFLDHYTEYDDVMKALLKTEKVARRKGVAIAIGHPKKNTIAALEAWLPTLQEKGIELVPITKVLDN